jgi:thioredoxin reductase (NADPH)
MSMQDYDVIVVGSGITGLNAARELAHAGLRVANLEASLFGGLVINVNELEGEYAGSGADLASTLMMEVGELGCATLSERATGVRREGGDLVVSTDAGQHWARAVVVASGATLRRLGVPGAQALEHKGVSQCADCDGPMYQGQDVVVVGGGDSALQEASVLARFCRTVHVVHRGEAFSARAHWVETLRSYPNVVVVPRAEVEAIEGVAGVEAVHLRAHSGASRRLPCAGVFAYVGLEPASGWLPPEIGRDARGAVITDGSLETGLRNVFAAGAVRAAFGGTLTHAVADACAAAAAVLRRVQAE